MAWPKSLMRSRGPFTKSKASESSPSRGLSFRHADGSRYGAPDLSPRLAEVHALALGALRQLGFRETKVRSALERVRATHVGREPSLQEVVRRALGVLVPD